MVAAPLIGAGTGGLSSDRVLELMQAALRNWSTSSGTPDSMTVRLMIYSPMRGARLV